MVVENRLADALHHLVAAVAAATLRVTTVAAGLFAPGAGAAFAAVVGAVATGVGGLGVTAVMPCATTSPATSDLRRLVGLFASPTAGGDGLLLVTAVVAAGADDANCGLGTGVAGVAVTPTGLTIGRPTEMEAGRAPVVVKVRWAAPAAPTYVLVVSTLPNWGGKCISLDETRRCVGATHRQAKAVGRATFRARLESGPDIGKRRGELNNGGVSE